MSGHVISNQCFSQCGHSKCRVVFCVKDLSIKMLYFVIFSSSLLFNVLSEFVLLTTMGPWQICNTLRFEQHDEHFVGTFFTK